MKKKIFALALCTLMALSLAACGQSGQNTETSSGTTSSDTNKSTSGDRAQIPNPFIDCETVEDAEKVAGFDITVPEDISEGYDLDYISAIKNNLLQINYKDKDGNEILLRKGAGSDDISGDYNEYAENNTVSVGDLSVTMRGNSGTVSVATWTSGDYTYAIDMTGAGLSTDAVSALVGGLK
ncbi:MAG: hypothetical protein VB112_03460 [Oscillospiraceae bacterium]|nr:hypothetical protein [Oscillospiraceae bacterium]